MISAEVFSIIGFVLLVGIIYTLYNYFNDIIDSSHSDICERTDRLSHLMNKISDNWKRDIDLLDQRLKDGIQSNALCCETLLSKLNDRVSFLERVSEAQSKKEVKDVPKRSRLSESNERQPKKETNLSKRSRQINH